MKRKIDEYGRRRVNVMYPIVDFSSTSSDEFGDDNEDSEDSDDSEGSDSDDNKDNNTKKRKRQLETNQPSLSLPPKKRKM